MGESGIKKLFRILSVYCGEDKKGQSQTHKMTAENPTVTSPKKRKII
jgi:hypothetical protein